MTDINKSKPDRKMKAFSQFTNGHLIDAMNTCNEICKEDSSDHENLCLLGVIYGQLNRFPEAIHCLRSAIKYAPEFINAHFNLAIALQSIGHLESANQELEYVVKRTDGFVEAQLSLGMIKMALGEYQQAIAYLQAVQQIDPGNTRAVAGEAMVNEKMGEIDRANEIIRPYVIDGIRDEHIAVVYGKLAGRTSSSHEVIMKIEQFIDGGEAEPENMVRLHFLLGSLYDNAGQFDKAFQYYKKGNALKSGHFNPYSHQSGIKQLIRIFGNTGLDDFHRSNCQSELPIFIVGMPRSGSSLTEQILATHKDIHGAGEIEDIDNLVMQFLAEKRIGSSETDIRKFLNPQKLDKAANAYLDRLRCLSPTALRITDKMLVNYQHLGYIALMFPNARVIHCKRNPIDTCLSCFFQDFSHAHDYTFSLKYLGQFYLGYKQLMDHWKEILPLQMHEVIYENLVNDSETEIRELVKFSGLEWDEQCLEHFKSSRITRTASYNQVRKPVYIKSINRWRNYEKHIGELISMLGDQA